VFLVVNFISPSLLEQCWSGDQRAFACELRKPAPFIAKDSVSEQLEEGMEATTGVYVYDLYAEQAVKE